MTPHCLAAISLHEFFEVLVYAGLILLICVIIPVQLAAKFRRMQRKHSRIICRICGYRFIRKEAEAICPHCDSRNR